MIKNNIKYDYQHDGVVYENRESILPSNTTYHEYVVPSESIKGPGHLRIVVGKNGSWYYTPDHFKTFMKFRP